MAKKVTLNQIDKIRDIYCDDSKATWDITNGDDVIASIVVKHRIPYHEVLSIISQVSNSVISVSSGDYYGEAKDLFLFTAIVEHYTNLSDNVKEDVISDLCMSDFRYELYDRIDRNQLSFIEDGLNARIHYNEELSKSMAQKAAVDAANRFEALAEPMEQLVSKMKEVDPTELFKVVKKMSEMDMNELAKTTIDAIGTSK